MRAKEKEFQGEYKIYASDIDENMVEMAKRNAQRVGFDESIVFRV
jgi:23S rRNA G2445 N2-methylase RlmL